MWNADGTGEPLVLRGHEGEISSAVFRPDGKQIVTASLDKTARIWTDLEPLRGAGDPRLWSGTTTYCLTVQRRMALLGVSEATATADQEGCRRRVEEARR